MKRTTVIETLDSLGDEFETERLIERLITVEKIEKGISEADNGKVLDYEVIKQKFYDRYAR